MESNFKKDVCEGLSKENKTLSSMYFYDDEGSRIFQEIMAMPEYYLTNCEYEILSEQGKAIGENLSYTQPFRLIELGAGDGTKTFELIRNFQENGYEFEYLPVDVSRGALDSLEEKIKSSNLEVKYQLMQGDYFEVLNALPQDKPALYLFLGANIGNYNPAEALDLVQRIGSNMRSGDHLMIGFDLKKDSSIVHKAYDDPHGITKRFNMNLLTRMNRELGLNFDLNQFDFVCNYNPDNGEIRSYLKSLSDQSVGVNGSAFYFKKGELINTELSKKYDLEEIELLAGNSGFNVKSNYLDKNNYFTDSLWVKKQGQLK
ncbi:MAG: hypothetical protein CL840_07530 [Crocinitomicaceae bacterium]|nr:hypothetical protein [Crocinitomicaceae bacterium]|tara:strand:+ start:12336 stop:13283 length:948 start_codon:yes stop_codon:yes gene_type:complete